MSFSSHILLWDVIVAACYAIAKASSLCLCVCLSHPDTVSKRCKPVSQDLSLKDSSFKIPIAFSEIWKGSPRSNLVKKMGKICNF